MVQTPQRGLRRGGRGRGLKKEYLHVSVCLSPKRKKRIGKGRRRKDEKKNKVNRPLSTMHRHQKRNSQLEKKEKGNRGVQGEMGSYTDHRRGAVKKERVRIQKLTGTGRAATGSTLEKGGVKRS